MSVPPTDPINPYSAPQIIPAESGPSAEPGRQSMPGFCKTIFIIELVFCVIRLGLVSFGIYSFQDMANLPAPLEQTVIYEIATGAGIAVFGIVGMGLLLARVNLGVVFGFLDAASTVASVIVGWWQLSFVAEQFAPDAPQTMGIYIGGGITTVIRLAIAVLLVVALVKYAAWKGRMRPVTKSFDSPYQNF